MSGDRGFRRLFRIGRYADRVERELDEELDFHFEETVEELVEDGWERSDAEREARRRFGDEERHRDRIRAVERAHRRRERGAAPWSALRDDVVFAARSIGRAPGFTGAVVVMLALGIGANATVFRLVDRLLLSAPDHVERPEEVRRVFGSSIQFNGRLWTSPWLTYPDYHDFTGVDAFREVAAYSSVTRTLGSGPEAQEVRAVRATASLFPLLGVRPALGRFFTAEEDVIGAAEPTAVLGHGFWERRFGADPGVLGRTIDIGRARYTIVGVAPEGFTGSTSLPSTSGSRSTSIRRRRPGVTSGPAPGTGRGSTSSRVSRPGSGSRRRRRRRRRPIGRAGRRVRNALRRTSTPRRRSSRPRSSRPTSRRYPGRESRRPRAAARPVSRRRRSPGGWRGCP